MYKIVDYFFSNKFEKRMCDILKTYRVFSKKEQITVFDIGCYIGNFSKNFQLELTACFDGKQIFHLFDPKVNNEILKKNLDFEHQAHSIAIDSSNGTSDFFLNTNFPASGSSLQKIVSTDLVWRKSRSFMMGKKDKDFEKIIVKTQTLDSFCIEKSIKTIDVLKIDVEGSELRVLYGATDILKTCSVVLLEVLDRKSKFAKKMSSVKSFMAENGFSPVKVKNIWSVSLFSSIKAADILFVQSRLLAKYDASGKLVD